MNERGWPSAVRVVVWVVLGLSACGCVPVTQQAYTGQARPAAEVATIDSGINVWIQAIDDKDTGTFSRSSALTRPRYTVLPGRHQLKLSLDNAGAYSNPMTIAFETAQGRTYVVEGYFTSGTQWSPRVREQPGGKKVEFERVGKP